MNKKIIISAAAVVVIAAGLFFLWPSGGGNKGATEDTAVTAQNGQLPEELTIDYANWSALSLIIKELGILEDEFKGDNVKVTWVFNPGGPKAMEYLLSGSADIAASADISLLLSAINGNPITTVYAVENREYPILVKPGSDINDLSGLAGKKLSVALATGPYAVVLKALDASGIDIKDINIVPLQHADGKNQLIQGEVDAWCGGDPFWTQAELGGARVIYRNPEFNGINLLSVRNEFLEQYPEAVYRVMAAYRKARQWVKDNPEEYIELISRLTKIPIDEARPMLEKNDFDVDAVNEKAVNSIISTGTLFQKAGIIKPDVDVARVVNRVYDNSYFEEFDRRN